MSRFLSLATIVGLLCLPLKIDAQYQVIELADVQLVKSLSAVVQDPVGSPLTNVLVQEVERFTAYNFRHPALIRSVCASR